MAFDRKRNKTVAAGKHRAALALKLTREFREHFERGGFRAINQLYESSPEAYLKIAVSLVPKAVDVELKPEASYQDALQELSSELHANTGMLLHKAEQAAVAAVEDDERAETELNEGHYPQMESEPDSILS